MKNRFELIRAIKGIALNTLNGDTEDSREMQSNLLKYYKCLNEVLITMLECALERVDDKLIANIINGYYYYVKAYNLLIVSKSIGAEKSQEEKEKILMIFDSIVKDTIVEEKSTGKDKIENSEKPIDYYDELAKLGEKFKVNIGKGKRQSKKISNALIKEMYESGINPYQIHKRLINEGTKCTLPTVINRINKMKNENLIV